MGDRGPMGLQGPAGKDAANGGGYRPSAYAYCELLLDLIGSSGGLGSDGVTETFLSYEFTRYSNGDLDVTCSAALGAAESAPGGSFFPSIVPGAKTGLCLVDIDYPPVAPPPGNVGGWTMEFVGAGVRATYQDRDAGHPLNGQFFMFVSNRCASFRMSDANVWMNATLADVL